MWDSGVLEIWGEGVVVWVDFGRIGGGEIVVCGILGVEGDVVGELLQFWVAGCRKYGGFWG